MQGSSNNSFIPKRKTSYRRSSKPGRSIFLITVVAYSLLFAALLSAVAVTLYKNYTITELEREVVLLDGEVNTFSVQNYQRVQEFDYTLQKAQERVDNTVSVTTILDEIDDLIAQPIQIETLDLERRADRDLLVSLQFTTQTLDAALFQRKLFNANTQLFTNVTITEVNIENNTVVSESNPTGVVIPEVRFVAEFTVPLGAARFDPATVRQADLGTSVVSDGLVAPIQPTIVEPDFEETEEVSEVEATESENDSSNDQDQEVSNNQANI